MAAIITFFIFILNDIIDQALVYESHELIMTIKLLSATLVLFVYVLILVAIYNKSVRFQEALSNLIGAQIDTSLKLKLQTHMKVSPHEFGKILTEHFEEFNFTISQRKDFKCGLINGGFHILENKDNEECLYRIKLTEQSFTDCLVQVDKFF